MRKVRNNPNPDEGHYIIPIGHTVVPVGEEFNLEDIPAPKPEEDPQNEPEENPDKNPNEDESKSFKGSAGRVLTQKRNLDEWRVKLWKDFDEKAKSKESTFITSIKKIAKRQNADVKERIAGLKEVNDATVNNLVNDYFNKDCNKAVKLGLAKCWLESMEGGRENAFCIASSPESRKP